MKNELDSVEEYSIDEAFFQIKAASKLEATDVACKLKDKVELLVGIPVSIGIATSKTLAKYANGLAKKSDGVAVVTLDEWASRAPEVPLSAIWGVGLKTAHHFRNHNLHTVQDYLKTDVSRVAKLFGVNGQRLLRELQGVPSTLSAERIPQKSIVSSRSFAHSSTELLVIKDALSFHVSEIGKDLRVMRQKTKYIRIFILPSRHGDFVLQGASAERVLEVPTNDSLSLLKVAHELLQTIYKNDVPYQKAGVAVAGFVPENIEQLGLFSEAAPVNAGALMQVVDTLNQSFGKETVTLGSSLRGISWRAKTELRSPSYTTKWTELQTVQS
jgi:DNA polymerase V